VTPTEAIQGPRRGPEVFDAASVPAATLAVTERLRRQGAAAPVLSERLIGELRSPARDGGGSLAVEPRSPCAEDLMIRGPAGPLRLRVLRPQEVRACYVHLHGGGWALGGPDRQDQTMLRFARAARVVVIAVDYRLTPEHPHPAGLADCVAAIRWVTANGESELGARRVIVGGESAGAHLAALSLLVLRDHEEIGAVTAANLAYGVYDLSMTPSARRWGDQRIVINTPDLAFFAELYARRQRHRDPDVSPLYADLTGMPTALFSCGTLDPLLDDTLFMAARWQAAGSPAELVLYPGAPHEFLNLRDAIAAASQARQRMIEFVDRSLTGRGPC
jgi:acetyl esterase